MNKQSSRIPSFSLGFCGLLALTTMGCTSDGSGDDSEDATSEASVSASEADSASEVSGTTQSTDTDGSSGDGDTSSGDGDASSGDGDTGVELENFSFFLTSLSGMQELSGSPNGFGGNLTYDGQVGIAGADHICETLAEMSMPGSSAKQWRAFLSTTSEDAIDRVGTGPWYDRNGRLLANDLSGLLQDRPNGDQALANDLANEWGTPNAYADGATSQLDNHDTMTASGSDGRLILQASGGGPGPGGPQTVSTCQDWTSAAPGQDPPAMGHSWPGMSGTGWLYVGSHGGGCEATVHLVQDGSCNDNPKGEGGVGCGGGYGGFYCLALNP